MFLITIRPFLLLLDMIPLGATVAIESATVLQQAVLQFTGGFLELAIVFFILALVAAALGASGVAGVSMTIAKWFVIIFVALAIISLIL